VIPESLPKPRPNTDVAFQQRSTGGEIGSADTEVDEDEEIATAGTLLDASGAFSASTGGAEATPEPEPEPAPVATAATVTAPALQREEQVATYAPMSTGKMAGIAAILLVALIFSGVLFLWLTRGDDEVEGEPEEGLAEVVEVEKELEPIAEVVEEGELEEAPEVADDEPEPGEESEEGEEAEPEDEAPVVAQPEPRPTRQEARPVREETRPATRPTRETESGEAREEDEVEEVQEPTPIRGVERRRGGDQSSDEEEERDEPASLPLRRR
jgi:hypothetical protein